MNKLEEPGLVRENHYVPRALLRRWSTDGKTVWAYRLLVSHSNVPQWQKMSVRNLASQRDLYTISAGDQKLDAFERWITKEYEQPANRAIDKVLKGDRLKRHDWYSLARFVALQDVRTPSGFLDLMQQLERDLPGVLDGTMREAVATLERAGPGEVVSREDGKEHNEFSELINVSIEKSPEPESNETFLRAEVILGRRSWIASMHHLLKGRAAEVLCDHQWSIAEAAEDIEWPLTDHPVLKLNYYGPGRYDFRGGWGKSRGDIVMPLTPRHLLFVEIGKDLGRKITLSHESTLLLRKFLLERAYRWVFTTKPMDWVSSMRPREINLEAFVAERDLWKRWHQEQSAAETSAN